MFYPEGDVAAGKCELELEVAAREGRFEDEGWRVRKDGIAVLGERRHHGAARSDTATLVGFGKVTRDLTERKAAEEQRRVRTRSGSRCWSRASRTTRSSCSTRTGNVATWNAGAAAHQGLHGRRDHRHATSRGSIPRPTCAPASASTSSRSRAREGRFEDEGWRVRKDGSRFWANVVISAMRDDRRERSIGLLEGHARPDRSNARRGGARRAHSRPSRRTAPRTSSSRCSATSCATRSRRSSSALQLLKLRGDTRIRARASGHRAPGRAHDPARRRPARCLAHLARQDRAEEGADRSARRRSRRRSRSRSRCSRRSDQHFEVKVAAAAAGRRRRRRRGSCRCSRTSSTTPRKYTRRGRPHLR